MTDNRRMENGYLWFNIEYRDFPTPMDIPNGLEFRTVPERRLVDGGLRYIDDIVLIDYGIWYSHAFLVCSILEIFIILYIREHVIIRDEEVMLPIHFILTGWSSRVWKWDVWVLCLFSFLPDLSRVRETKEHCERRQPNYFSNEEILYGNTVDDVVNEEGNSRDQPCENNPNWVWRS